MKEKDINSLDHTSWRCQYHVVFSPKYRSMAIYREIKTDIGKILRQLCQQKGVEIIEAELCPDHIHMLISIPPKYKYGNRHFWARGYFVDTVGRNKNQVAEYIRNQLASDQISLKEYIDPFTGSENKKA